MRGGVQPAQEKPSLQALVNEQLGLDPDVEEQQLDIDIGCPSHIHPEPDTGVTAEGCVLHRRAQYRWSKEHGNNEKHLTASCDLALG